MAALAERVGLSYRYLFRLRSLGVFEPAIRRNKRVVFYNLKACEHAIKHYMQTGEVLW